MNHNIFIQTLYINKNLTILPTQTDHDVIEKLTITSTKTNHNIIGKLPITS